MGLQEPPSEQMPSEDTAQLAHRARRALGSVTGVADVLHVKRTTVDAWLAGAATPTRAQRRVLRDLAAIADRLRSAPRDRLAPGWMRTPCDALDGATPEDVLVVDGATRVLDAIDRMT